jgi:hypothetical protein
MTEPGGNDGKFQKGSGGKRKGRPPGALNRMTRTVRDAIAEAAEGLGGHEGLVAWAKKNDKNEFAFWTSIYPKLLPLQLRGDAANPIQIVHRMERLIVDPADPDG